jgi:hypothetical protein
MITLTRRTAFLAAIGLLAGACTAEAADWTQPAEVLYDLKPRVSYRAALTGDLLMIQVTHEPGWHTVAMDNQRRVAEKLGGRQPLGVDTPTEIKLLHGLQLAGPWHQSPPKDFSRPELELFTWGFEGQAMFAAKVRRTGAGPAQIAVGGQACTDTICKKFDLELALPLPAASAQAAPAADLKNLVPVR